MCDYLGQTLHKAEIRQFSHSYQKIWVHHSSTKLLGLSVNQPLPIDIVIIIHTLFYYNVIVLTRTKDGFMKRQNQLSRQVWLEFFLKSAAKTDYHLLIESIIIISD